MTSLKVPKVKEILRQFQQKNSNNSNKGLFFFLVKNSGHNGQVFRKMIVSNKNCKIKL